MNKLLKAWHTIVSILKYPSVLRKLKAINSEFVFFFPFYQTGGGEQVHADIMHAIKDQAPICVLTEVSHNEGLKQEFEASAEIISLYRLGSKRAFKKIVARKIAHILNTKKNLTVFTSNCPFFDLMIPHLHPGIIKIDLIHTYLGHTRDEPEHRTLPHVHLLNWRVVLGEWQKSLTADFYKEHGLDSRLADRIIVIPNKAKSVNMVEQRSYPSPVLNVLFVSRNSFEKRPEMFVEIAKKVYDKRLPIRFTMIGDFEEFNDRATPNLELPGLIMDRNLLNTHYSQAHLILITSEFEGFPMVLLEGMTLGVVPISTWVGEIPFHINESLETGFIIDNQQSKKEIITAFVDKLEDLLENQYVLKKYSENVKKLVRNHFSEENFNQAYRSLLLIK